MRLVEIDAAVTSRAEIIACARTWLGTRFSHQASVKGEGTDCAGLIRGVLVECGALPKNYKEILPRDFLAYATNPDGSMQRICDSIFEPVKTPMPGDIGLFRWFKFPQHLAFFGDYVHGGLSMIQALGPAHPRSVIENRFDRVWINRMVATYRIPGIR